MPILTKKDILAARQQGLLRIDGMTSLNATSLDVRIGQLLTPAMDRKDMKPVPLIDGNHWIVGPRGFFLYETIEFFYLSPFFHGRINSRSSWARYGAASVEADDGFTLLAAREFHGNVICRVNTFGTTVKIRPGDAIAQAHLAHDEFMPVSDKELEALVRQGLLEVTVKDRRIDHLVQPYMVDGRLVLGHDVAHGMKMNGGFTLTCDDMIKVYRGGVIDPHNPDPSMFEEVHLPENGIRIPKGTFFLSSSAECVKIDRHYVGWVGEWNNLFVVSGYRGPGRHADERASCLHTHASAPKIDPYPRFCGKITFENLALDDVVVRPGDRITELYLIELHSPYVCEEAEVSRFKGQVEATCGKAHLDVAQGEQQYHKK